MLSGQFSEIDFHLNIFDHLPVKDRYISNVVENIYITIIENYLACMYK